MDTKADVLIIGGGAIGVCSAYYISQKGLRVVLVDKGEVCSGSSYGNAGLIVPSHCVPLAAPSALHNAWKKLFTPNGPIYLKPRLDRDLFHWVWRFRQACSQRHLQSATPLLRQLSLASARMFEELSVSESLSFGYEKTGYLRLYNTASGLQEGAEEIQLLKSFGVNCELLNREQIQQLEPGIRIDVLGGVSYPEDAHVVPSRFVRGLAERLVLQGGQVLPFTEVFDFETSGRTITRVKTTRGDFAAKEIVLSAGSWVPEIIRNLGIRLPIQGAKGYSFTFKKPARWPAIPFSLGEAGVAVTAMDEFLRISGTFALVGLDLSWNTTRMRSMLEQAPQYLPDLEIKNLELLEVWRGLRPCSPDGLPFLGRSPKHDNLIVAAGHAMIGVSLSPITGKLVSQVVTGEQPSFDLTALRVDRFE
jgi:D-amino-acid dehydrogenase